MYDVDGERKRFEVACNPLILNFHDAECEIHHTSPHHIILVIIEFQGLVDEGEPAELLP